MSKSTPTRNELKERITALSEENRSLQADLLTLRAQLEAFNRLGWNEARGLKLRRLEIFYIRFINAMANISKVPPFDVVMKLVEIANQELKYLPDTPWVEIPKLEDKK